MIQKLLVLCFLAIFDCAGQAVSTSTVSFPDTAVSSTSLPIQVTLQGPVGGAPSLSPLAGTPFNAMFSPACATIPADGKCQISITFLPTALGASNAVLTISGLGAVSPNVALSGKGVPEALTISGIDPTTVVGTSYTLNVASNNSGSTRKLALTSNDKKIMWSSQDLTLSGGKGAVTVQFGTEGPASVTVTDTTALNPVAAVTVQTRVLNSSASALEGCGTCFAMIGAGSVLSGTWEDYVNSSNVLQTTHIGKTTPQLAAGLAFRLPFRSVGYDHLKCDYRYYSELPADGFKALCYPFKVFASLKFSPDASQTFNGFTYGISHAVHQYFDILVGISYSPFSEISPGFRQAAINVVQTQQSLPTPNPYYAQWKISDLQSGGSVTAFDGFPTQLLKSDGTTGPLIYTGNPLVSHYHAGFFMGISLPIKFKSSFLGN